MSLTQLSLDEIFRNISNAFVGTINDLNGKKSKTVQETPVDQLLTQNRYMYLALLVVLLLLVAHLLYNSEDVN